MITSQLIEKITDTDDNVRTRPSRCARMRFNKNSCNSCREYCVTGAISIDGELRISKKECSECMLCTSVCPSGAVIRTQSDFYSLVSHLAKFPSPVLGCRIKSETIAHERTSCLGFLSEEHLIALSAVPQGPFQINLIGCKDCQNGHIVNILKERLKIVRVNTDINIFEKIKLVEDAKVLNFQEIIHDRRSFFQLFKNLGIQGIKEGLRGAALAESDRAYSDKALPIKRKLLNESIADLPRENRMRIFKNYYFMLKVKHNCTLCKACVKICPTGAIRSVSKGTGKLYFLAAFCTGCRLCEDFCRKDSIQLLRGISPEDFDEFMEGKVVFCSPNPSTGPGEKPGIDS